jgi:diguanylate cyclase (GGDEF)-like protein
VVDDEPFILPTLAALLAADFDVVTATSAEVAEALFARPAIDIILTDQKMPGRTGIQLLEWVRQHHPSTVRLLMTGYAELQEAIEAINRGQVYYYLLKPWRTEDLLQILRNASEKLSLERSRDHLLDQLQRLNRELEERVTRRTQELQQANHLLQQRALELERLALTDPLTGLFNRRAIDELVRFELKRHARYPGALAVGYIDIDHFKDINTQYLLTGGDAVLKGLSRILTSSLRELVDSVGRVGGEEFLVLARETDAEGASALAERIRSTVETTPIPYERSLVTLTVSIGFAVADASTSPEVEMLLKVAARALQEAKDAGRNRSVVCSLPSVPLVV